MDDTTINYDSLPGFDVGEYGDDGYSSPPSSALSPASSTRGEDEDGAGSTRTEMENFTYWPFGFQLRAVYDHGKKNPEIMGVTYNGRMRQFVVLDSKGITTWSKDAIEHTVQRAMSYPKYEYRLITHLVYVRKYNVYFVLSKDFAVKVLNRDFEETCRVSADLRSVLFMLFNPVTDELITGGVGGTKVWRYHQVANKTWKEIRPMANYKLTLKYELKNVGGSWVKKVELDLVQQHLYCCSDTDLHAYDMEGNSLFQFERAHAMSITGCAYSQHARLLVTASADREVKVWSVSGGLVHTFRGHSQAVTDLVLHPECTSLIITSSLDGTVRMWSLDILEPVYSLVVSTEGVRWMGLTEDNLLYLSTARNLSVWSLNTTVTFWSLARCKITSLKLAPGHNGKSTRIVALGEDSSVRILSRGTQKSISMVMPPPPISPLTHIRGVTHVRDVNVSYVLINSRYLWLYTNRSDPACRMAVWDLLDIQTKLLSGVHARGQTTQEDKEKRPGSAMFGGGSHRATLEGSGNETVSECRCICYLNSPAAVSTEEGLCCPIQHQYLLLGLEDGRILFMDPLIKGTRYMEFRANKDAISHMEHDERHSCLVTRCDLGDACLLQFWDLPSLRRLYEVYAPPDVCNFTRLDDSFLTGHESGAILLHKLIPVQDGPSSNKPKSLRLDIAAIFASSDKSGHRDAVTSLDVCYSLRLFLSASTDGLVKIWDENKSQVSEIQLDETLTTACFLNDYGDVIAAFKNHIFLIDRNKVSDQSAPSDDMSQDDGEESDQFEDISMLNDLGESNEPIDMRLYLVEADFDLFFRASMVNMKVPYKSALAKEFSTGGKYVGVDSPSDLQEILNAEEDTKVPSAPSEIYDSPRSTPHDLALIDLTLTAAVTDHDLGIEPEAPPAQTKPKRMTPKERRRALHRKSRVRTVQFDAPPKYDPKLGVNIPQFGGSPCSTPRSSMSSLGSGDGDDGCSWLSYSTGGRSTPDDLSWDSDEDYEEASDEEGNRPGSPSASPRRERKTQPPPSSVREAKEGTTGPKPEEEPAKVRRRSRFADNIRIDAKQLMEEEEMKKRAERKRQRRQADQAVNLSDKTEEEATVVELEPAAVPPKPKIREIKKKEKRAARRVSSKSTKVEPKDNQKDEKQPPGETQPPEKQTQPSTDQVKGKDRSDTQNIKSEKAKAEEERIKKEKEKEAEEERKRLAEEEEKQREEQIRKEKEQEAVKAWKEEQEKLKQEQLKKQEEEEKKKQAALELLERDKKERERKEALQKSKADRDAKINALLKPDPSEKQSAKKRAPSAKAKPKSAKGRVGSSTSKRTQKSPSSAKHKRAPQVKVASEAEPASQMAKMEPEEAVPPAENETEKKKQTLSVDIPQVDVDDPAKEEVEVADKGTQSEQQDDNTDTLPHPPDDDLDLTADIPSSIGLGDSMHSQVPLGESMNTQLPLGESMNTQGPLGESIHSHVALTEPLSLTCPGSPTPTSLTGFSEFPGSLLSPPLSPSRLSMVSSRPPTSVSFFSRPLTGVSEVSKRVKTVTFSPPSSPPPMGMPPSHKHHDVHSWLASAADDVAENAADDVPANAESVADNLLGDARSEGHESRSRSPAGMSDAGSEMTVPHVDIPLSPDRDDDWWWRKSRRRRMKSATPSGEISAEVLRPRPHTAHVISNLTMEELEKAFEETLHHYQGYSGTPEKLHQNEGTHFDDNWHDRAIERHMLLKMQRQLRAQSANEKARRLFREQQERRCSLADKKSSTPSAGERPTISVTRASSCMTRASTSVGRSGAGSVRGHAGGGGDSLSPGRAHSVRSMPTGAGRRSRTSSAAPSVKTRPATAAGRIQYTPAPSESGRTIDKAELGAEVPFRCRLNPALPSPGRSRSGPVHKEEIDMRLLDPRNPVSGQFRPRTGASVPSKCSRYVLVESTRIAGDIKVMPTVLEQRLIEKRFPQHQEEWIGHAKPPPRFRPPLLLYHPPAFNQYATT